MYIQPARARKVNQDIVQATTYFRKVHLGITRTWLYHNGIYSYSFGVPRLQAQWAGQAKINVSFLRCNQGSES
jgi:hypothetical protein